MANEKTINARLQQKHDIEAHWKLATNFIPKAGEIIVYDDLNKIKIGDGTTNVNKLPFTNGNVGLITKNGGEIFNDYSSNTAVGAHSHSEGTGTTASGKASHTEGHGTKTGEIGFEVLSKGETTIQDGGQGSSRSFYTLLYLDSVEGLEVNQGIIFDTSDSSLNTVQNASISTIDTEGKCIGVHSDGQDGDTFVNTDFSVLSRKFLYIIGRPDLGSVARSGGDYAHAEGYKTEARGLSSHAEGYSSTATGDYAHSEGEDCSASGSHSHAEGFSCVAKGPSSHAEGSETYAVGGASHSEGSETRAAGAYTHAEGESTLASGDYSHSEGWGTQVTGKASHAEGANTRAVGDMSHAEGSSTWAGESRGYRVSGTSNLVSVSAIESQLDITTSQDVTIPSYVNVDLCIFDSSTGSRSMTFRVNIVEVLSTNSFTVKAISGFLRDVVDCSSTQFVALTWSGLTEGDCSLGGDYAHAEGNSTHARGMASHAEGWITNASGHSSHSEGKETEASGNYSHAEGESTSTGGIAAHAEGFSTNAAGDYSHAEGQDTYAEGHASHAEGSGTQAWGDNSHASGLGTIAAGENQTVVGQYNEEVEDAVFVAGCGTSDDDRRNAFVVNKDGTAYVQNNKKLATEEYVNNKLQPTIANSIKIKDRATEIVYSLYIENGELRMEVAE